jgi:hypothetical protein
MSAHLARFRRGLQQALERRAKLLPEIDRQRLECWIARVQRSRPAALGCNDIKIAVKPVIERVGGLALGGGNGRRVCAGIHFVAEEMGASAVAFKREWLGLPVFSPRLCVGLGL